MTLKSLHAQRKQIVNKFSVKVKHIQNGRKQLCLFLSLSQPGAVRHLAKRDVWASSKGARSGQVVVVDLANASSRSGRY